MEQLDAWFDCLYLRNTVQKEKKMFTKASVWCLMKAQILIKYWTSDWKIDFQVPFTALDELKIDY